MGFFTYLLLYKLASKITRLQHPLNLNIHGRNKYKYSWLLDDHFKALVLLSYERPLTLP